MAMAWFRRMVLGLCILYVSGDSHEDLKYLASIFPGFYDNIVQYENDIKHHLPPAERHEHLSMNITPQDIPILEGRTNFYLEEYVNGNPNEFVRQRLYSYGVDKKSEIELKFYSFVDPTKFAHPMPDSPLFKNLTWQDVSYIKGCDVYWDRVDDELFRSHMFNSCVVPFNGIKIIITDTNDLSPWYLTVKETWIVANNGTVIRATPVPYNLTKHSTSPESRLTWKQLVLFEDIHQALISRPPVRFHVDIKGCKIAGGQHLPDRLHGSISTFTYLGHEADPHIGFITSSPIDDKSDNGSKILHLRGSLYRSGSMKLSITPFNYNGGPPTTNLECSFGSQAKSASVSFYVESPISSVMKNLPPYL